MLVFGGVTLQKVQPLSWMLLGVCCLSPGAKIQPNLKPSIHSRLLQSFGGVGHPHEEGGWMSGLFSEAGSKG